MRISIEHHHNIFWFDSLRLLKYYESENGISNCKEIKFTERILKSKMVEQLHCCDEFIDYLGDKFSNYYSLKKSRYQCYQIPN